MATLISMEQSAEEVKEQQNPTMADAPKYPWGLFITLNDDSLEKLGITTLPTAGTTVTILARAEVTGTRENQTQGNESEMSVDLQITDMQVEGLETDRMSRAMDALYGKSK